MFWLSYECFSILCDTFLLKSAFPAIIAMACCIFGKLEIRTLAPSRFKSQTNDTLKLFDRNSNHQQRLLKPKMLLFLMLDNRATVDT